jgi:hypothetical protein
MNFRLKTETLIILEVLDLYLFTLALVNEILAFVKG